MPAYATSSVSPSAPSVPFLRTGGFPDRRGWLFPGRAWSAAELRRKSFRDLHTLWYVLLRERNLIATQMESYRRADVARGVVGNVEKRAYQVRSARPIFFNSDPLNLC